MDYLTNFCDEINRLNYQNQCEYIINKLLSLYLYNIQYILLFKKLHVLIDDLPGRIKKNIVKTIGGIYTILVLN